MTAEAPHQAGDTDRLLDSWVQVLREGLVPLRRQRQWTQGELGARSGLHPETIGRLERLRPPANRPSEVTLRALASAFGYVRLNDLWHALQVAATEAHRPDALSRRADDVQQLVVAYLECTTEQQHYLRGLATIYAARRRSQAIGQLQLVELPNVPYPGTTAPAVQPGRTGGRNRHAEPPAVPAGAALVNEPGECR